MSSKIRIKMGEMEVEYEGSEEFMKQELLELVSTVSGLFKKAGAEIGGKVVFKPDNGEGEGTPGGDKIKGTTGTIAGKLQCKSGTDLAIAAAARLTLVDGRDRFSYQDVLAQMKAASGYFKKGYGTNLTNALRTLTKQGKLIEVATNTYTIESSFKQELEQNLAT